MLILRDNLFTLERAPDGRLILTVIATGEVINLGDTSIYELSEFLLQGLEILEADSPAEEP